MITASNAIGHTPDTDVALLNLLRELKCRGYHFVTVTPETHARILRRSPSREACDLRGVLGWSLPFRPHILEPTLHELLRTAGVLDEIGGGRMKSRVRVSSLGDELFLHSAYPTDADDAVFFGPDSYRFADLIGRALRNDVPQAGAHLVDIGAGAGVGAIVAAKLCPALQVTMTDVNPNALGLARINAQTAGVGATYIETANLDSVTQPIDIALANPPYIMDDKARDYRDGGEMHGAQAAYDMAVAALARLAPGGRFVLYTGSAIVAGEDKLFKALGALAADRSCALDYREIDPDVFGEELENPAYADVERIALIACVISRHPLGPRTA